MPPECPLWHVFRHAFVYVRRVPCAKATGQPIFAQPNGDEAWVLLLEKAMAKFKVGLGTTVRTLACNVGVLRGAAAGEGHGKVQGGVVNISVDIVVCFTLVF